MMDNKWWIKYIQENIGKPWCARSLEDIIYIEYGAGGFGNLIAIPLVDIELKDDVIWLISSMDKNKKPLKLQNFVDFLGRDDVSSEWEISSKMDTNTEYISDYCHLLSIQDGTNNPCKKINYRGEQVTFLLV